MIPDYIYYQELPTEINYYDPIFQQAIPLSEDQDQQHQQFCIWCAYQSFWYYCVQAPKVSNQEFDYIKQIISKLEFAILAEPVLPSSCLPFGISPVVLGFNQLKYIPSRYPDFIQMAFSTVKLNPRYPIWWKIKHNLPVNNPKKHWRIKQLR